MPVIAHVPRHILANALRIAATQYSTDAEGFKLYAEAEQKRGETTFQRLVDGFTAQSAEANALANTIEQADTIQLED